MQVGHLQLEHPLQVLVAAKAAQLEDAPAHMMCWVLQPRLPSSRSA
jgi:hypothetical protein